MPLDDRVAWAKFDWQMCAAACAGPGTRGVLVSKLARWINETSTDKALADWYSVDGEGGFAGGVEFAARGVVGGHFAMLALQRMSERERAKGMGRGE